MRSYGSVMTAARPYNGNFEVNVTGDHKDVHWGYVCSTQKYMAFVTRFTDAIAKMRHESGKTTHLTQRGPMTNRIYYDAPQPETATDTRRALPPRAQTQP